MPRSVCASCPTTSGGCSSDRLSLPLFFRLTSMTCGKTSVQRTSFRLSFSLPSCLLVWCSDASCYRVVRLPSATQTIVPRGESNREREEFPYEKLGFSEEKCTLLPILHPLPPLTFSPDPQGDPSFSRRTGRVIHRRRRSRNRAAVSRE